MIAIGSLLVLVAISLVVTRIATLVLVATGMSRTAARFQARSALTGAGFTTSESEQVVGHPLRRKVIMALMLAGNIGIVASASTLILGFSRGSTGTAGITVAELVGGLFLLVFVSRNRWVDRRLTRLILRVLRRYSRVMRRDVSTLVDLGDHFAVCELYVKKDDWLAGRALGDIDLAAEGLCMLGIQDPARGYHPAPGPMVVVNPGMTLIVHGPADRIDELDRRKAGPEGDAEHAVAAQLHANELGGESAQ